METAHRNLPGGRLRARGAGIPFQGEPGTLNAITDVPGVSVGYSTLVRDEDIRTGVTAILPRQDALFTPVFAGIFSLNGNGELTGSHWIEEAGRCDGPVTITNTNAVGIARDASVKWLTARSEYPDQWLLPVAAETFDGYLNDIQGFHVEEQHVLAALDAALASPAGPAGGRVDEGNVGGGTGMICYGYKGGSGTASRVVEVAGVRVTLGAFVQANFGRRHQLQIAGVPVGRLLNPPDAGAERGSIIVVIATDAPLLPHQLKRLARRAGLGIGRSGAIAGHGSGDIFLAFSTANAAAHHGDDVLAEASFVPDACLDPLFAAVIEAVDEAIINTLVAAETMTGKHGTVDALPVAAVLATLASHGVPIAGATGAIE